MLSRFKCLMLLVPRLATYICLWFSKNQRNLKESRLYIFKSTYICTTYIQHLNVEPSSCNIAHAISKHSVSLIKFNPYYRSHTTHLALMYTASGRQMRCGHILYSESLGSMRSPSRSCPKLPISSLFLSQRNQLTSYLLTSHSTQP